MSGLRLVEATLSPALRPYVTRLAAYREHYAEPVTRVEVVVSGAVLVLGFAAAMEVGGERLTRSPGWPTASPAPPSPRREWRSP